MSEQPLPGEETKPRSRWSVLLRPWVLISLTVVMFLVAAPLVYRSTRFTGIPPIDEIVDRETEGRFEIQPEENAFTSYEAAWKRIPKSLLDEPLSRILNELRLRGWEDVPKRMRELPIIHRAILDEWKRGTEHDRGVAEQPVDVMWYSVPVRESQLMVRLSTLHIASCLDDGMADEAWEWLRAQLRFSRHLGNPGGEIDRTSGMAIYETAAESIAIWASHESVTAEQLSVARDELRNIYRMTAANASVLKCEYIAARNLLDSAEDLKSYCRTDFGSSRLLDGVPRPLEGSFLFLNGEPDVTQLLLRHCYANLLSQCDLPREQRTPSATPNLFRPSGTESPALAKPALLARLIDNSWLSRELAPTRWLMERSDRERALQVCLETCLSAELFRRRHGDYPPDLAALVPEFLDQIPRDPFGRNPSDTLLMTLRKLSGDPPENRLSLPGLIIYSRGSNEVDDGGTAFGPNDVCVRIPLPGGDDE